MNLKYKQTLQQLNIQIKEEKETQETYALQLKNTLIDSQKNGLTGKNLIWKLLKIIMTMVL
ncbi:hypothetical protein HUE46_01455 [Flavobacterium columnare]|uniref:Uncharacterized protein n=1 Tax=Flavobacterium columnare TaxID=996 RepID=A0AA94F2Y2_9FLAO|nr:MULTISPECIES: hypothetical protein [Flavobacterium]OXA83258.1 hypothetical protein B0A56_02025 [Flavobacterium columnare NBRC 100251 = ATCC 23463]AMA49490.1 hypothetical protein AWN65_08455 [Flavobacterium covae]MCH4828771.1 hypothetical protein [Flavobacterium columnare]MCH4832025.1 hypothetical protein [Flavobacterium columnare]MCJ1809703.1 hypothetical protein [Flavobacterium covae]